MKLLLVCNPGGHFSTMMGLKKFWSAHDREWVTFPQSDTRQLVDGETVHWVGKQEAREFLPALTNFARALAILRQSRPDMLVSTGSSLAVPFILAAKLLGVRTLFVESISRVSELSMSGRLIYNLADEFYVQWPECAQRHTRAVYRGMVL